MKVSSATRNLGLIILAFAAVIILGFVLQWQTERATADTNAKQEAVAKMRRDKMRADAPQKLEEAKTSLAGGDVARAANIAKAYEPFFLPGFKEIGEQAKLLKRKQDLDKARGLLKKGDHAEAMALAAPYGLFPDPEAQQIMTAARKAGEAEIAKIDALDKARRKKEGVRIGMTKKDVLMSSWGRPESINVTSYSFGDHEQWVYPGFQFLYFENDKLTTIQSHR